MAITGGFGMYYDFERGSVRQWVMGKDGVKRWAENGEPVSNCIQTGAECFFGIDPASPNEDRTVERLYDPDRETE